MRRVLAALQKDVDGDDERRVQRQAFAGLLWGKQYYGYDVRRWMHGDPAMPPPPDATASSCATATGAISCCRT